MPSRKSAESSATRIRSGSLTGLAAYSRSAEGKARVTGSGERGPRCGEQDLDRSEGDRRARQAPVRFEGASADHDRGERKRNADPVAALRQIPRDRDAGNAEHGEEQ